MVLVVYGYDGMVWYGLVKVCDTEHGYGWMGKDLRIFPRAGLL